MRVALLTNFIPPYRLPLYEALAREAGELRVFISTRMESNRSWSVDWGSLDVVTQQTLTITRSWRTKDFAEASEMHFPYDTLGQLRRFKPDVIITGEMGARSVQAVAFAKLTGTPVLLWATLSERTESDRGGMRRAVRRWLLSNVTGVIVNGESGARYIRSFGVTDDKLLRVPYTADMRALLELPAHQSEHDSEVRLLYVGSLTERKGLQLFVDGLAIYAGTNSLRRLRLTLVGDGALRQSLLERSLPDNLRIEWLGSVPYGELPKAYAQADIFVFPSLSDEWGVVVNEALAAGLPVLGSCYSQAVEELVRDGTNGWVFAPTDTAAVEAVLARALATSNTALAAMRVAARDSVRRLTPEAAAHTMVARIRTLVAS